MNQYKAERKILHRYAQGKCTLSEAEVLRRKILNSVNLQTLGNNKDQVFVRRLVYFPATKYQNPSYPERIRIIYSIIRTRGLMRWLSLNLFSNHILSLSESYNLSRVRLLFIFLRNCRITNRLICKHLRIISIQKLGNISNEFSQNDYFKGISGLRDSLINVSVLETRDDLKLIQIYESNNSLIDLLIQKDTKLFLEFMLESEIDSKLRTYLMTKRPDLASYLDARKSLLVKVLLNSNLSFDQLNVENEKSPAVQTLHNVEIWHQRFITDGRYLFEFDITGSISLPFVAGHWQFITKSRLSPTLGFLIIPKQKCDPLKEAIFLCGRADENWYHFLMDTFPRFLHFKNIPAHVPVLIRADLPETTLEFFKMMTSRKIIQIPSDSKLAIEKLHLVPGRSTVFDSLGSLSYDQVQFSPNAISETTTYILHTSQIPVDKEPQAAVFIKRNSRQRRLLNETSIRGCSSTFGLKEIADNAALYRRQVALFADSKLVVSAGGAVLANMIFMKPRSTVLCLKSNRDKELKLWHSLAAAVNVRYIEVTGWPTYFGRNTLRRSHSNFIVRKKKFYLALKAIRESMT